MFNNLKIQLYIKSPIITYANIYFDSIINYLISKDIFKERSYSKEETVKILEKYGIVNIDFITDYIVDLKPFLDNILDVKYGVYCCSNGIGEYAEKVAGFSKRYNTSLMHNSNTEKSNKIDIGAGFYKSYRMSFSMRTYYNNLDFYVRGDIDKIKELLKNLNFIGKKTSYGYGKIGGFNIIEIEENKSIFNSGELMRCIPIDNIEKTELKKYAFQNNYITKQQTYKPPYWRKDAYKLCYVPTT